MSAGTVMFTVIAGILGTVAAGTLEYDILRALDALPMIMVALIEEASKILVRPPYWLSIDVSGGPPQWFSVLLRARASPP